MKWVIVAVIAAFFVLLLVRAVRRLTLGQATIHMAHLKSESDALHVGRVLRGLPGMVEVHVDLEGRVNKISYRKTKIAIEEIMRALHAAGF
jgi:copper chaperone CopZ